MRDPGGWSMPSGVPEASRMNTGTSTVDPAEARLTVPTVTVSAVCAIAGTAANKPRSSAKPFCITVLLLPIRARIMADGRAADVQRAGGDGRLARAGGVAQYRNGRIDVDGDVRAVGRVDLDLRDDTGDAVVERNEVRERVARAAADLERRLQRARGTGAMDRGVAHAAVGEDDAQRHRLGCLRVDDDRHNELVAPALRIPEGDAAGDRLRHRLRRGARRLGGRRGAVQVEVLDQIEDVGGVDHAVAVRVAGEHSGRAGRR